MSAAIGAACGSPALNVSLSRQRRRAHWGRAAWLAVAWLAAVLIPCGSAWAADGDEAPAAPPKNPLATRQAELAAKFQRFEQVLVRLAEYSAKDDPERAALLRKAIQQSKKEALRQQFAELATQLEQGKLSAASRGQEALAQELVRLLELLLSEDALKRLAEKEARIKDYLKKVNGLIKEETDLRAQTEKAGDLKKLAEKQGDVADKAGDLQRQIAEQEGGPQADGKGQEPGDKGEGKEPGAEGEGEKPGEGADEGEGKEPAEGMGEGQGEGKKPGAGEGQKPGEGAGKKPSEGEGKKPSEGAGQGEGMGEGEGEGEGGGKKPEEKKDPSEGGAKKPGDQKKPGEGKKPSDAKKPGDKEPGDEQEPSEGEEGSEGGGKSGGKSQSQPGQQGQGGEGGEGEDEQQDQQQGDTEPARKRIAAAEKKLKDAQKKLEKAQREQARDKQEEALEDLRQAKAELEEILRQIREEEMERMLAMLEARFRKMLEMQVAVYEGTLLLSGVPETQWKANLRTYEIEAGKLSRRESQIVLEANKALAILMEEGSAVAFPEAVVQMRDDMEAIVQRLGAADVGTYTQKVEEDVLRGLEEMIAALQKAQKEMEAQKGQPGGGGQPPDQPLIDNLAELKMVRALQERINRRTELIRQELQGREQVDRDEHIEESKKLAEREERIYNVLRGIVTGANQ